MLTDKYYVRDVCAIEPTWLIELAPQFYELPQAVIDTREEKTEFTDQKKDKASHTNAGNEVKRILGPERPTHMLDERQEETNSKEKRSISAALGLSLLSTFDFGEPPTKSRKT